MAPVAMIAEVLPPDGRAFAIDASGVPLRSGCCRGSEVSGEGGVAVCPGSD